MSIDDLNNPETRSLLTDKVSCEGAALLLAMTYLTRKREEQTPTSEAASSQVTTKGWRYPKPGDKLRVVKFPEFAVSASIKIGEEFEMASCTTVHGSDDKIAWAVSGANSAGFWVCLPLDCVEPA